MTTLLRERRPRRKASPLGREPTVGAAREDYAPALPSEAALARLWWEQRLPAAALVTRQGVSLRVIHPGQPGRGAGPDFRDAVLETPSGAAVHGDIEVHVLASAFRAHGHHRDPRYDRLALHLVFEDDEGGDTPLVGGRRAPVVALAPWLARRRQELAAWLSRPALWQEPCRDARERLGPEGLGVVLDELGGRRLAARERRLRAAVAEWGPEQALYEGLLEALGYGGNREAMLLLARLLPWRDLRPRLLRAPLPERYRLAAVLILGTAGLPASGGPPEGIWREEGRPSLPPERWRRWGLRPANRPERRLAGAAVVLSRHAADLLAPLRAALADPPPPVAALLAPWTARSSGQGPALIGKGRALEILVNIVLPLAAVLAEADRDREGATRARQALARLPRAGRYGVTLFLEEALGGRDGRRLHLDARRQQGLLHLHHAYCAQGACGRCPLS